MAKVEKFDWIIGIGGSEADGVDMHRFHGTEYQAKRHIVNLVKEDRRNNAGCFEYGTEKIEEVEARTYDGSLYAYGCYSDYHIDYEAARLDKMETK